MGKVSTNFLRAFVIGVGLAVLAVCIFVLPAAFSTDRTGYYQPIILGMYGSAVPFFIALYQTIKLLGFIDKNQAFSSASAKALGVIKYCAATISALYASGMPYIYYAADMDDAPGVIVAGLVIIFASMAIGVFAAVLQKLLQSAMAIKSENDLTV